MRSSLSRLALLPDEHICHPIGDTPQMAHACHAPSTLGCRLRSIAAQFGRI
jgi:hypothetical protein